MKYGYDRNSNPLWKENVLSAGHSELFTYDGLNRLSTWKRGQLNTAKDGIASGTQTRSQDWTLDSVGNWGSLATNGTSVSRTHDLQNKLTAVGGTNLTYDANGNQLTDGTQTYTYDAWNQMRSVTDTPGVRQYRYDALGRRWAKADAAYVDTQYLYSAYGTGGGQLLLEGTPVGSFGTGSTAATYYYTWSIAFENGLVSRETYGGSGGTNLTSRVYVQTEANWNTSSTLKGKPGSRRPQSSTAGTRPRWTPPPLMPELRPLRHDQRTHRRQQNPTLCRCSTVDARTLKARRYITHAHARNSGALVVYRPYVSLCLI